MKTINVDNPIYLPLAMYDLIFSGSKISYQGKPVNLKLVTMRAGGTIRKANVGDFLYLEQNPNKDSEFGRLAKAGNSIMWVIYKPTEMNKEHSFKPGTYLIRVMNGVSTRLV